MPKVTQDIKSFSSKYIKRGWRIVPANGKYPTMNGWNSFRVTEVDENMFDTLCNNSVKEVTGIALLTGQVSGVTVVDFDFKNGAIDFLEPYMRENNLKTSVVRTGSGGLHYYFNYIGPIGSPVGFRQGVDLRNDTLDKSFVAILPPSVHPTTGLKYEWIYSPETTPIIDMPKFLLDELVEYTKNKIKEKVNFEFRPEEGERNNTFVKVIGTLLHYLPEGRFIDIAYPLANKWNQTLSSPQDPDTFNKSFKSIAETELRRRAGLLVKQEVSDDLVDRLFESVKAIKTGIKSIDHETGGFKKGQMAVMIGDSGMGKSIVALNMLMGVARQNIKTCYIDLENGKVETMKRVFCIFSGKSRDTFTNPANKAIVRETLANITNFDYISYELTDTFMGINEIMKILDEKTKEGVKLFLIDPLQKMEESTNSKDNLNEQGKIAKKLVEFAVKNEISILVLHHMRKHGSSGQLITEDDLEDKLKPSYRMPTLNDSKGSSKITDYATDVWGYWRFKHSNNSTSKSMGFINVLKSRSGLGNGDTARFFTDRDNMRVVDSEFELSNSNTNLLNFSIKGNEYDK